MRSTGFFLLVCFVAVGFTHPAWAGDYKVDPVHSSAVFKARHYGISYIYGMFTQMEGVVKFDAAKPESSSVNVSVKTSSVTTHNQGRDRHLSGPDFFNAKEFPAMTFKSSSWKKTGDGVYEVTGELSILGVKKTITTEVRHGGTTKHPRSGKELIGFHTSFEIDRTDFGMNYGVTPDDSGLGKTVEIIFSIEGGLQ